MFAAVNGRMNEFLGPNEGGRFGDLVFIKMVDFFLVILVGFLEIIQF